MLAKAFAGRAGRGLVLANVRRDAEVLRRVRSGGGDHRNSGLHCVLDRRAEGIAVGDGHDEFVRLLIDGRFDHLRHRHHFEGFGRAILELTPEVVIAFCATFLTMMLWNESSA